LEENLIVSSRLDHIKDWKRLARVNGYSTSRIAKHCRISVRQLERFFKTKFDESPREWLHGARMEAAAKSLSRGLLIKEIASQLGYKDIAHFSHDFKTCYQVSPTKWRAKPT
jgi:AraC family transcriptional activator of pobA